MPKLARSYDANYPEYHASFQYSTEVYYGSSSVGRKIHYSNLRDENRPKRKTSKKYFYKPYTVCFYDKN